MSPLLAFFVALGTVFGPPATDRGNRGGFACDSARSLRHRSVKAKWLFEQGQLVAAPKGRLPCWAVLKVTVPRTGQSAFATVADRLPQKPWRSLNDLDLWTDLARLLGHNGMEIIHWQVVPERFPMPAIATFDKSLAITARDVLETAGHEHALHTLMAAARMDDEVIALTCSCGMMIEIGHAEATLLHVSFNELYRLLRRRLPFVPQA